MLEPSTESNAFPPSSDFYYGDDLAIRFTSPHANHIDIGTVALEFLWCLQDLSQVASVLHAEFSDRLGDPGTSFRCDKISTIDLREPDNGPPFLTYATVMTTLAELIRAAGFLSQTELWDGAFEVWFPGKAPVSKVLDGYWSTALQRPGNTTVGVYYLDFLFVTADE